VHFTADAELRELIERARELASHRVPKGDLASLMKLMVANFVKQEEKRRFGIGARPSRGGGDVKSSGTLEGSAHNLLHARTLARTKVFWEVAHGGEGRCSESQP
jgi:hypothetical protein